MSLWLTILFGFCNVSLLVAASSLERQLIDRPHDPTLLHQLADYYYQAEDFDQARNYYQLLAAHEQPAQNKAQLQANIGATFAQQERYKEALAAYEKAQRFDKDEPRAKKNIPILKKLLEQQKEQQKNKQNDQQQSDKSESDQDQSEQNEPQEQENNQPDKQDRNKQKEQDKKQSEEEQQKPSPDKEQKKQQQKEQDQQSAQSKKQSTEEQGKQKPQEQQQSKPEVNKPEGSVDRSKKAQKTAAQEQKNKVSQKEVQQAQQEIKEAAAARDQKRKEDAEKYGEQMAHWLKSVEEHEKQGHRLLVQYQAQNTQKEEEGAKNW